MHNPDEDGIDPVTIYRFQENTRRLDRLRAELTGQPIAPPLPALRNGALANADTEAYGLPPQVPSRLNLNSGL